MYRDKLISNIFSGRNRTFFFFTNQRYNNKKLSHLIDFNSTKQKQKSYVLRNHPMG